MRLFPVVSLEILDFKSVDNTKTPRLSLASQYSYSYTLTACVRHMTSVKVPRLN